MAQASEQENSMDNRDPRESMEFDVVIVGALSLIHI